MPPRSFLIALEGSSGSGKSTLARSAARAFDWTLLPEAYDRIVPAPSLRFTSTASLVTLETRLLEEEGRRYRAARSWVRRGRTVIADTGFLGPLTYTAGLVALGKAPRSAWLRVRSRALRLVPDDGGVPDGVVYLDVPSQVRRARAAADPAGHPTVLARRHEAVGRVERRFYLGPVARLLAGRFRRISGVGPPKVVLKRLAAAVGSMAPAPRPTGLGTALREALDRLARAPSSRRPRRPAATVKNPTRPARAPPR